MRTLITLDYELYFGRRTGTPARTLLQPTEALARIAERRGARLVIFVDAGYLVRLRAQLGGGLAVRAAYDAVCRQLDSLRRRGHELQLHVHPHWEDSSWGGDAWRMDTRRFGLQAFDQGAIGAIVRRYAAAVGELAGAAPLAYRAGGWLVRPFAPLRAALLEAGIRIDSTVFRGGLSRAAHQPFDFRAAPDKSRWRFDDDPLVEAPGPFLEVPIASYGAGRMYYVRHALVSRLGGERHRPFGDGATAGGGPRELAAKLLAPGASVVSIDGYKASFLGAAARHYRRRGLEDFVVIGHPKAVTPYSLERLDAFLGRRDLSGEVVTFAAYSAAKEIPCHPLAA